MQGPGGRGSKLDPQHFDQDFQRSFFPQGFNPKPSQMVTLPYSIPNDQ